MRISKISGEFWKKEDSDRTGNCWENGDSRVKSTEIFVFLAQNCRIFWISNCTFSIKNGKTDEKVLQNGYKCAIIRAVRYRNEPSFLPWGTASFYQKQCRFLLQCRRSGQRETQKLDRLFPTTVGFAGQCTLLQRIRASLLPRFSLHRTTALPTDRTACFGCRTSDAAIDCCIRT